LRHEAQNPGEDARGDPSNGKPEEGNALEDRPYLINIVQQNAVIVTGQKVKGGRRKPDKSNSGRWL